MKQTLITFIKTNELSLLLVAGLVVRLPWIFVVPMVEAPDEFAHYWVIKFIAEHMRLPTAVEVAAGGPSAVYGSLPQLGYIPHLLFVKLLPFADLSLVERLGSLLMGVVTIWCAWRIGRELFPDRRTLALALPWLLVFHPQLVLVHAYANNDSTTVALSSCLLLLAILALKRGPNAKQSAVMGILAGWLALTKYSGYAVFPVLAWSLLFAFYIHRVSLVAALACLAIIGSGSLAVCLWWFVRNYNQFNHDLLGTLTMRRSWAITYGRPLEFHMSAWQVIKELRWWRMTAFSFWGMFGYMTRYLWRPLYFIYLGFMLAAVGGAANAIVRAVNSGLPARLWQQRWERKDFVSPAIWLALALCLAVNVTAMVYASTVNLGGPQGRYLFVSEIPFLALLIGGLACLGDKLGERLVVALVFFNALVYVCSFAMLASLYGFHLKTF